MNRSHLVLALVLALGAPLACGDDPEDDAVDAGMPRPDAAGPLDAGPPDGGAPDSAVPVMERYALMIRIRQPDGTTNATYLETRPTLSPTETITTRDAREFTAQLRFRRFGDALFLEDVRQPTLVRLDYDPATGDFVESPILSFQPRGLTSVRSHFLSATKAYAVDGTGSTIAIFDPASMVLRPGTIDISGERPAGFSIDLLLVVTRGNRTFVSLAYSDLSNPAMPAIERAIIVAVIDNENDQLLTYLRDERCGNASGMVLTPSGDIYIHGDNGFNLIDMTRSACIVRIPAGQETFDDYVWRPAADMEGRESSRLQAAGGTLAVTYALHPERLDLQNPLSIVLDPVRRPWVLDLEARTATVVANAPFTKTGIPYEVNDELWLGLSESFDATDLYRVDPANASATLEARSEGQVFSLTRLP